MILWRGDRLCLGRLVDMEQPDFSILDEVLVVTVHPETDLVVLDLGLGVILVADGVRPCSDIQTWFLLQVVEAELDIGALEFQVARNFEQEDVEEPEYTISHSVARKVLETGEPVLSVNALGDDRFAGVMSIEAIGVRSVLCLPLRSGDEIVGMVLTVNLAYFAEVGCVECGRVSN